MKLVELKNLIFYGDYPTSLLIKKGLVVGKNFNRQDRTIIDKNYVRSIIIGNNVTMAPRSYILAHDASTKLHIGYTKVDRVVIGDNVFIGAGSIIMPGVSVGDNVIIGAMSVVTKDIPSGSVVVGNPARFVCVTSQYIEKISLRNFERYNTYNDYIDSCKKEGLII